MYICPSIYISITSTTLIYGLVLHIIPEWNRMSNEDGLAILNCIFSMRESEISISTYEIFHTRILWYEEI